MANPAEFDFFVLFGNLGMLNPFNLFFGNRTTHTTTATSAPSRR
jgi:hypothetical protein